MFLTLSDQAALAGGRASGVNARGVGGGRRGGIAPVPGARAVCSISRCCLNWTIMASTHVISSATAFV